MRGRGVRDVTLHEVDRPRKPARKCQTNLAQFIQKLGHDLFEGRTINQPHVAHLLRKVGLHAIWQGAEGQWAALGQQDADDDRRFLPTVQADGTRPRGHWPRGRNLSRFDLCECLSHATT